ncbi:MAG: hypothetical protein LBI58_06755, partial [Tannerellaceae bacterium]|nr:hypothetical protein [Tannerellaceae bacterium]
MLKQIPAEQTGIVLKEMPGKPGGYYTIAIEYFEYPEIVYIFARIVPGNLEYTTTRKEENRYIHSTVAEHCVINNHLKMTIYE